MDWTTLGAAFIGGISGGGLGSAAAFARLRTDRRTALRAQQWLDAEVVADVRQLLKDIDPARRGINLSSAAGDEDENNRALRSRSYQVERELLRLAAGHPNTAVAECAHDLSGDLVRALYASDLFVRDAMTNRHSDYALTGAKNTHAKAIDTAKKLELVVKESGRH